MSGRYPSEEELARIKAWPVEDCDGLFAFVFSIWEWPDFGCSIEGDMWRLATGGWSGNEDIIEAINENFMVYAMCWQRSERGGLHWYKAWRVPSASAGEGEGK